MELLVPESLQNRRRSWPVEITHNVDLVRNRSTNPPKDSANEKRRDQCAQQGEENPYQENAICLFGSQTTFFGNLGKPAHACFAFRDTGRSPAIERLPLWNIVAHSA